MRIFSLIILSCFIFSACTHNVPESAQKTASDFASYWQDKDWDSMYGLFTEELTLKRSKENFSSFMDTWETEPIPSISLSSINIESKGNAKAVFSVKTSLTDSDNFITSLVLEGSNWKIYTFEKAFIDNCAEECIATTSCKIAKCSSLTRYKCIIDRIDGCCEVDLDCPDELPRCVDNRCDFECRLTGDCSKGKLCSKDNKCVECMDNSDCKDNDWNKICDPFSNTCVQCIINSDCPFPNVVCSENNNCVECLDDSYCSKERVCFSGRCRMESELRKAGAIV